jgi:hypothetical protein
MDLDNQAEEVAGRYGGRCPSSLTQAARFCVTHCSHKTSTIAEHIQPPLATVTSSTLFLDDCQNNHIDATGNEVLQTSESVCVVCTRQFGSWDTELVRLNELKENKQLVPTHSHPAHVLTEGFHDRFPVQHLSVLPVHRDKTPPLSLTSGIWIGEVPLELKILAVLLLQTFQNGCHLPDHVSRKQNVNAG